MSAPSPPQGNPLPRVGPTTLEFWWDPPATDGGSAVTSYTLQCTAISYSQSFAPTDYYALVTGLTTGTNYSFFITATNTNGTSDPYTFRQAICGNLPSSPQTFTSTITPASANLSWTAPASDGGATLKYYSVYADSSYPDYVPSQSFGLPASRTSKYIPLCNGQNYNLSVFAVNDPGYSSQPATTDFLYWSPSQLSSCILWLDSGVKATTNNLATGWADRSPANRFIYKDTGSATAELSNFGAGPISTVVFNGTVMYNTDGWPLWSPQREMACFCVVSSIVPLGVGDTADIFGTPDQDWPFNVTLRTAGTDYLYRVEQFNDIAVTATDTNGPTIVSLTQNSAEFGGPNMSTVLIGLNASTFTSSVITNYGYYATASPSNILLAKLGLNQPYYNWNGPLCEFILCSNGLNQVQREKTEGYLAWKWGLQSNLPPTHPYYTSPPPA